MLLLEDVDVLAGRRIPHIDSVAYVLRQIGALPSELLKGWEVKRKTEPLSLEVPPLLLLMSPTARSTPAATIDDGFVVIDP